MMLNTGDGKELRVAVVLVNWKTANETIACIESLMASEYPVWRIYVVDNASNDGSCDAIKEAHPQTQVIQSSRNLGYAGGFNLGRLRALEDGADYIWLLNNDTVVDPNTLGVLLEAGADLGPTILSPRINYMDRPEVIWYSGGGLDWRMKTYHIDQGSANLERTTPVAAEWATGCAMLFSSEIAQRVGAMDERYFLYLEDVDWCLRARDLGVSIYCIPKARILHCVSTSVEKLASHHVDYYSWRNYYLLVKKHGRHWQRIYATADLLMRFLKTGVRLVLYPSYRNNASYQARTRGLVDFVRGRFGEALLDAETSKSQQSVEGVLL
jgi:GT2 family glycosyltransferase